MNNYQGRIREIQSAFVMGYQDRETCFRMFEELLHDYNLLPVGENLDRAITNENFLQMLKLAKDHRAPQPAQQTQALAKQQEMDQYRLANAIKQRCPVCQKPAQGLYNRMQDLSQQIVPIDPPRCHACMTKWIEERFGTPQSQAAEPAPQVAVDHSIVSPMRQDELDFFAQYEKQMSEPS
jgi:hypothetical protein